MNFELAATFIIACSTSLAGVLWLFYYRKPSRDALFYFNVSLPYLLAYGLALYFAIAFRLLVELPIVKIETWYDIISGSFLAVALMVLVPFRYTLYGLVVFGVLLAMMTFADTLYYRQFMAIVPLAGLLAIDQLWDVQQSIADIWEWSDIATLFLPIIPWVFLIFAARVEMPSPWTERSSKLARTALLTFCLAAGSYTIQDVYRYLKSSYSWKVFHHYHTLSTSGLINARLRDLGRTMREWVTLDADIDEAEILEYLTKREQLGGPLPNDSPLVDSGQRPNVVLIQIEGLQNWVLDTRVGSDLVAPMLTQFAKDYIYFSRVFDASQDSPTINAEYSILNSLLPLSPGPVAFRRAFNDFVSIPQILASEGYQTLSAHAYAANMWNRDLLHPRWGFRNTYFSTKFPARPRIGWGLSDEVFLREVAQLMKSQQEPYFLLAITLTSHHPYNYIPKNHKTLSLGPLEGSQLGDYLHSMAYVDQAFQAFWQRVPQDIKDRTIFVVYGDHDARLRISPAEVELASDLLTLGEATMSDIARRHLPTDKIPLIIAAPGLEAARINTVGSQVDVGPTLLHLLGLAKPKVMMGQSLFSAGGFFAGSDGSCANRDLIFYSADGESRCVDYSGNSQPLENCDQIRREGAQFAKVSRAITLRNLAAKLRDL